LFLTFLLSPENRAPIRQKIAMHLLFQKKEHLALEEKVST
jgi:hypothetical protein